MSRLSRERIAQEAIALADDEGLDALSMRRIAARLGAGTMSLYHYVRTKDELFALVGDAVMGELVIPAADMPSGWREGLRAIAFSTKACFDRHPWVLLGMLQGQEGPPGVSLMRHADQTIGTLAGLDLSPEERLHLTGTVDEYVMGYVFRERVESSPASDPAADEELADWFNEVLAADDFPHFRAMFGADGTAAGAMHLFEQIQAVDRFEPGLELVLDGIAVYLERRSGAARPGGAD